MSEVCCPHCWRIMDVATYERLGMCVACLNLPRGLRKCPGDSSKTVAECVVGRDCGCDESLPQRHT